MIKIKKNPNGDTRTAPKNITFEQFQEANDMHRGDVAAVMYDLSGMVDMAGEFHDCTKKTQERIFFRDFIDARNNNVDFKKGEWYALHINSERHHLFDNCPSDVNLIDVLEMIVDHVCAGLARSGEVKELKIDSNILNNAINNTVELIKNMVEVEE